MKGSKLSTAFEPRGQNGLFGRGSVGRENREVPTGEDAGAGRAARKEGSSRG